MQKNNAAPSAKSKTRGTVLRALAAAFPFTVPILAGFVFLGATYGIYMHSLGFVFLYPMLMSMTIFAGSMEFVAADMLVGAFNPVSAFVMTLMVNARHLFYGLSMLEKYKGTGAKKFFLIFGMCDESFSVNCAAYDKIPSDVDKGWFMLWVTVLNYTYWVVGSTLGGILGSFFTFDTKGLEFAMTAMFAVIFLDDLLSAKNYIGSAVGVLSSLACLLIFGKDGFIIPSMIIITVLLTVFRSLCGKKGDADAKEDDAV